MMAVYAIHRVHFYLLLCRMRRHAVLRKLNYCINERRQPVTYPGFPQGCHILSIPSRTPFLFLPSYSAHSPLFSFLDV